MSPVKSRYRLSLLLLLLFVSAMAQAQNEPLASGELEILGQRLRLYTDPSGESTDALQTINVGERASVRTCFGGPGVPCGSLQAGDPRIAGLLVEAELRGPELISPLELETVPGGTFVLPGFQVEGDYSLENIRLVKAATGEVLSMAEPSVAVLQVRQILLTSASVKALTLEELRARGIELTEENFQAFDFAVGFAFGSEIVEISFPVQFEGQDTVGGIGRPVVKLDGLPPDVVTEVERWKPPVIVPFRLAPEPAGGPEGLKIGQEEVEELQFPVFGVIVLPGTVTYLNQFFDASLLVVNGAPEGSGTDLRNLRASIRLPGNHALRLARTEPPVSPGQEVPVVPENGSFIIGPLEKGQATWTVEGLAPGTHSLFMDLQADLYRPGRDPLPISSRSQAAVEVVDARFHLTFSHPDVVREGEAYTLFVTVANESLAVQNLVSIELKKRNLSGAHAASETDDLLRTIDSLAPGESQTVEFELISDTTGQVVATTFQAESNVGLGTISLRAGVGELGIPLSPATLVMPRYTRDLEALAGSELLRANNRLLGLAYSLAVAPASALPPQLTSMNKTDVERRALDLGEAGQRVFLGEGLLESAEVLLLDQLGNRHRLDNFDRLRRLVVKGLRAGGELAKVLRQEQRVRDLSAQEFFDHFAGTTSYADPFLATIAIPQGASDEFDLEIQGKTQAEGSAAFVSEDEGRARRTLPWAEIYRLEAESGLTESKASFGVVGRVEPGQVFTVIVSNPGNTEASSRVLFMVPTPNGFARLDFGSVTLPAGSRLAVDVPANGEGLSELRLYDPETQVARPAGPSITLVELPPFRIIGVRQEFRLIEEIDYLGNRYIPNRYGHGLTYLFNRPPSASISEHPDAWEVVSTFDGFDVLGNRVQGTTKKVGDAVFIQDSGRVVNVLYSGSISPLLRELDNRTPLMDHEHDIDTSEIVDQNGEAVNPVVPPIRLETSPEHTGGLVGGRVVRGNGEAVAGARVELIRQREFMIRDGFVLKLDPTAETYTDADGRYFFDFVERPIPEPQIRPTFLVRATVDEGNDPVTEPAGVEEVGSIIRQNNKMAIVNIALLGRGAVYGHLKYEDDDSPVPFGKVEAASTLFNDLKSVEVDAAGAFRINAVPVGPITLTGRDREGRTVYATVEVAQSGSEVLVELRMPRPPPPGVGTVGGWVLQLRGSRTVPVPGARVAVYANGGQLFGSKTTASDGSFVFLNVPAGQVSLQASDFRLSRTAVFQDEILPVGGTVEAELRIPESFSKTIRGRVLLRDIFSGVSTPLEGAKVFIEGPGQFATTDAFGRFRISEVPTQANGETPFNLKVLDLVGNRETSISLPLLVEGTIDPVEVGDLVIESGNREGGVRGVVLDPLGRPAANVELVLYPLREGVSTAVDGSFFFENVPLGSYQVVAHVENGLEPGRVGYFGRTDAILSFPGHQPFVTVQMVGSGTVRVHTRTSTSTGILTPIYFRPTYYSQAEKNIALRGKQLATSTDPNGFLELNLPVGPYEIVAYNPFHGIKTISGEVPAAGALVEHEIVFEDAGTVAGQVVAPDGVTPVPFAEVVLRTGAFLPQTQTADALGRFEYSLVPKGPVVLEARGLDGAIERVGSTLTYITLGGQEIDVPVQLKRQGSVAGRVVEIKNGQKEPVEFAQFAVFENSFPFRRFPADGTWFAADAEGEYELSHLYAGKVTVVARDPIQPDRSARVHGEIIADWQRLVLPDIEFSGALAVGTLEILVRDPVTGAPVPDAQVKLSNGELNTSGPDGRAVFESLRMGTYSAYVFYAPSGRSARVSGMTLSFGGELVLTIADLNQRGEVLGTVFETATLENPVPGAVVDLTGQTAGGYLVALATASTAAGQLGRFEFLGIPEGTFTLTAAERTSPRRARLTTTLSATSPEVDVNLVLEPLRSAHIQLLEKRIAGVVPVDLENGLFSVRLLQQGYDFTRLQPEAGGTFLFPDLLWDRSVEVQARELDGDLRQKNLSLRSGLSIPSAELPGAGTTADPFRLTLDPKGVVRVQVRYAGGDPAAGVRVRLGNANLATGGDGVATFVAVNAGPISVTATNLATNQGGFAQGTLLYDDQVLELNVQLNSVLAVTGTVYEPPPNDRYVNPELQVPMVNAVVEITDSANFKQVQLTDEQGRYRFEGMRTGNYSIVARNYNGDQEVRSGGSLQGANGQTIELPGLVLDASPPRIMSISPASGATGVSRDTTIAITFNEPLHDSVLPVGASSAHFQVKLGQQVVAGLWSYLIGSEGGHIVRFQPSELFKNNAFYSIVIKGGENGVIDRQNRPLTSAASVGSSFRTSDSVGPTIQQTLPDLSRAVDPAVPLRFDFSEQVVAENEMLDGDGFEDAATLEAKRIDGTWVELPLELYLTRSQFSLQVNPLPGLGLPAGQDSLRRRIRISRLEDSLGNPMQPVLFEYRLYDTNSPVLSQLPLPAGAADGNLLSSLEYILVPQLSGIDDVSPTSPGGDLDRVEYYITDPDDPDNPPQLAGTVKVHPFSFSFKATYVGNGIDPRPFPLWARAFDTSSNKSEARRVDLRVLPNGPPVAGLVTVQELSGGTLYVGGRVVVRASQYADLDGGELSLTLRLRRTDTGGDLSSSTVTVTRPASGWAAAPERHLTVTLPTSVPVGTSLIGVVEARDSQGLLATASSSPLMIESDTVSPVLNSPRMLDSLGREATSFEVGQSLSGTLYARDDQSGLREGRLRFDRTDLFGTQPYLLSCATSSCSSSSIVATTLLTEVVDVVATFEIEDWGGNVATTTTSFQLRPSTDNVSPSLHWSSPWTGAAWPANYSSVLGEPAIPLLLRVDAWDQSRNSAGQLVAGFLSRVEVRLPARQPDGSFALSETWTAMTRVAGETATDQGTFEVYFAVPNALPVGTTIPFEARVLDGGGQVTTAAASLVAVPARKVYEGVNVALDAEDPMLAPDGEAEGPVFLLGGSTLSLFPQPDGALRRLPALYIYSGVRLGSTGQVEVLPSTLTTPEVVNIESVVKYRPLELEISSFLGVGDGSSIDLTGRGLLGGRIGTSTVEVTLPGIRGAAPRAGGSHGGLGLPGNLQTNNRTEPGEIYDSIQEPRLPGGGGRSELTNALGTSGGGVVFIDAKTAEVRIEGSIQARGGSSENMDRPTGAGGAIQILADRVAGRGVIDASGGAKTRFDGWLWGIGGGGRVALHYRALAPEVEPQRQFLAQGGQGQPWGGAGTVYLEEGLEPGNSEGLGRLFIGNGSGRETVAGLTPLPGPVRYLSLEISGQSRVLIDTDFELGPEGNSSLNDRSQIVVGPGAALFLPEDGPVLSPEFAEEVTPVEVLSTVPTPSWTVADPFGIVEVRYGWASQPEQVRTFARAVSSFEPPIQNGFAVPGNTLPGTRIEYRVTVRDELGRTRSFTRTFEVLANRGPQIRRAHDDGEPVLEVTAGSRVFLLMAFEDAQGLQRASFELGDSVVLSGTFDSHDWAWQVPSEPDGTIIDLNFKAWDILGAESQYSFQARVRSGNAPVGSMSIVGGSNEVEIGGKFVVRIEAQDVDFNMTAIGVDLVGPTTETHLESTSFGNVTSAVRTFEVWISSDAQPGQTISASGFVTDRSGNRTELGPIELVVSPDITPPESNLADLPARTLYADQEFEIISRITEGSRIARIVSTFAGETVVDEQIPVPNKGEVSYTNSLRVPRDLNSTVVHRLRHRIVDIWGNATTVESAPITFAPDLPPTLAIEFDPSDGVEPGENLVVRVQALDDGGLDGVYLDVIGAGVSFHHEQIFGEQVNQAAAERPSPDSDFAERYLPGRRYPTTGVLVRSIVVPVTAQIGDTISISARITDAWGHETSEQVSAQVGQSAGPAHSLYIRDSTHDDVYPSGTVLSLLGIARERDGIHSALLTTPEGEFEGYGVTEASWTLPQVSQPTLYSLVFEATGASGLRKEMRRTIRVVPPPSAVQAEILCPSEGAVLPVGDTFSFVIRAASDLALSAVELYAPGRTSPIWTGDPAGASTYTGEVPVLLGELSGARTYRLEVLDVGGNRRVAEVNLEVVEAVELSASGSNDWAALATQTAVLRTGGTLVLDQPRTLGGLIVMPGATITHLPHTGTQSVNLEVAGPVYVACGGKIDATGKGYAPLVSFLGTGSTYAGNHLGRQGNITTSGSTYGNPAEPREAGAGGAGTVRGGGVVYLEAAKVVVDGQILANAEAASSNVSIGGAGGSIWLRITGTAGGQGTIEAKGAVATGGTSSGGGGSIALEAAEIAAGLADRTSAAGGPAPGPATKAGGPGAFYFRKNGESVGHLRIDGQPSAGVASLPVFEIENIPGCSIFGPETTDTTTGDVWVYLEGARSSMVGRTLEVQRSADLREDFTLTAVNGSQVRLRSETGTVLGASNSSLPCQLSLPPSNLSSRGDFKAEGIETTRFGEVKVAGLLETEKFKAEQLEILPGGLLSHPNIDFDHLPKRIVVEAQEFILWPGGAIDVTGRSKGAANAAAGGSHLGVGGGALATSALHDLPDMPSVPGGSSSGRGGGVVRIESEVVYLATGSSVKADGQPAPLLIYGASAGGSIHLTANQELNLQGEISASGGSTTGSNGGGGGGGAVALEYGRLSAGSRDQIHARGGNSGSASKRGGAGTVVFRDLTQPLGDLIVDNGPLPTVQPTVLPGLGSGFIELKDYPASGGGGGGGEGGGEGGPCCGLTAGQGAGAESASEVAAKGARSQTPLMTLCLANGTPFWGRETLGHWIELTDSGRTQSALHRVVDIVELEGLSGMMVCSEVEIPAGQDPHALFGWTENWQGVYRFRDVLLHNAVLNSEDPLGPNRFWEVGGEAATYGNMNAERLSLAPGARLRPAAVVSAEFPSPEQYSLLYRVAGDLVLGEGARIDLTAAGPDSQLDSYVQGARNSAAATHIGVGGSPTAVDRGQSYDNALRPLLPGAGRKSGSVQVRGGGALAIEVGGQMSLEGPNSAIVANGAAAIAAVPAAAGGSIYVNANSILGQGYLEAKGGAGPEGGGGGAIALYYDYADETILTRLSAAGGIGTNRSGGAGSIYLHDRATAYFGEVLLDNEGRAGITSLPSIGSGELPLPDPWTGYYGRCVQAMRGGTVLAAWRFEEDPWTREGLLTPIVGNPEDLLETDTWRGAYYLDRLTVGTGVSYSTDGNIDVIVTDDLVLRSARPAASPGEAGESVNVAVDRPRPSLEPGAVSIEGSPATGLYRIWVPASAFAGETVEMVELVGAKNRVRATWSATSGAVFFWAGQPGETLQLDLFGPGLSPRLASVRLPPLPNFAAGPVPALAGRDWLLDVALVGGKAQFLVDTGEGTIETRELDPGTGKVEVLSSMPKLHLLYRIAMAADGRLEVWAHGGLSGEPDAVFGFADLLGEPRLAPAEPTGGRPGEFADFMILIPPATSSTGAP